MFDKRETAHALSDVAFSPRTPRLAPDGAANASRRPTYRKTESTLTAGRGGPA